MSCRNTGVLMHEHNIFVEPNEITWQCDLDFKAVCCLPHSTRKWTVCSWFNAEWGTWALWSICAAAVKMRGEVVGTCSKINVQTRVRCFTHLMPVFATLIPCCYFGHLKKKKKEVCTCFFVRQRSIFPFVQGKIESWSNEKVIGARHVAWAKVLAKGFGFFKSARLQFHRKFLERFVSQGFFFFFFMSLCVSWNSE